MEQINEQDLKLIFDQFLAESVDQIIQAPKTPEKLERCNSPKSISNWNSGQKSVGSASKKGLTVQGIKFLEERTTQASDNLKMFKTHRVFASSRDQMSPKDLWRNSPSKEIKRISYTPLVKRSRNSGGMDQTQSFTSRTLNSTIQSRRQ